jgi:hypothetical protein
MEGTSLILASWTTLVPFSNPCNDADGFCRMVEHVPQAGQIVMPRHTAPPPP